MQSLAKCKKSFILHILTQKTPTSVGIKICMQNYYSNHAYMHGYYNTCIYYFINFFSLLSLVALHFFHFFSLLSLLLFPSFFSFWLQPSSSSSLASPTPTSPSLSLALLWLRWNPCLHGPEATRWRGFESRQLQWVLNGSVRRGKGDERVGWEICRSRSWWFMWWWWWRWEDLRKFCLICLKSELFGLWENLGKWKWNVVWMFCGYFIMKWRIVIIVWLMRKWERGGLGLWEGEAVRER